MRDPPPPLLGRPKAVSARQADGANNATLSRLLWAMVVLIDAAMDIAVYDRENWSVLSEMFAVS